MAILSSARSRRGRKAEVTEQFIAFQLRQEWFGLPIESVYRVVTMGKVFGDPDETGVGLTRYQDQDLLVIDVSHRIFSEDSTRPATSSKEDSDQKSLIIIKNSKGELVGLPIDSQPEVKRFSRSQFVPLPATYAARSKIRCLSSMMAKTAEDTALFLLDPDQVGAI
ncbi:MAG: chemotaxis protein CheW [Cyanobacteria bacterium P01_A01_bin.17]